MDEATMKLHGIDPDAVKKSGEYMKHDPEMMTKDMEAMNNQKNSNSVEKNSGDRSVEMLKEINAKLDKIIKAMQLE